MLARSPARQSRPNAECCTNDGRPMKHCKQFKSNCVCSASVVVAPEMASNRYSARCKRSIVRIAHQVRTTPS